jgi:hypothetical protein
VTIRHVGTGAGQAGIMASAEADVSFANDATEKTYATLATPTTPALATGDRLIFRAYGEITNNSAAAVTYLWRLKIGGTTVLATVGQSLTNNAQHRFWFIEVVIALASPTAQRVAGNLMVSGASSNTWPSTTATNMATGYGIATEDLSSSKNVVLTCQMGTADPAASMTLHAASLERVPKVP